MLNISIYKIVLSSIKNRGLISSFNMIFGEVYYNLKYGFIFDYGVEASKFKESDYYSYQGTSWVTLRNIFKVLSADGDFNLTKAVMIDYGCGKGRAMIVALEHGVSQVIGVEYDKNLYNDCCKNLYRFSNLRRNKKKPNYECKHIDAKDYAIPNSCNTVFMYNPFGRETMNEIIINIKEFSNKEKKNILVIYVNPVFGAIFIENSFSVVGNIANDVFFYEYKFERLSDAD